MEGGGKHPPPQCYNETKKPSAYRVRQTVSQKPQTSVEVDLGLSGQDYTL